MQPCAQRGGESVVEPRCQRNHEASELTRHVLGLDTAPARSLRSFHQHVLANRFGAADLNNSGRVGFDGHGSDKCSYVLGGNPAPLAITTMRSAMRTVEKR